MGATAIAEADTRATSARTYTFVSLGWLGRPSDPRIESHSDAEAINRAGQVVGTSTTATPAEQRAFRWENGTMTNLGAIYGSPFSASSADGINDAGVVVGQTNVNETEPPHAFVYRDGAMTDLGTGFGAGSGSGALDINNNGVIVGRHFETQSSPIRAALWQNGAIRDLGTLGGSGGGPYSTDSVANAVNDAGQVVGAARPPTGPLHGFVWQNGTMRDLGTLGGNGEATQAEDISNLGEIAGWSQTAAGQTHAFLWSNGQMRDLGTLGGSGSFASGINDTSQVVGVSRTSGPVQHAFLWENGTMVDLNSVVTNLPSDVELEIATSINADGVIVGRTCYDPCSPGKTAPIQGYMLVPDAVPADGIVNGGFETGTLDGWAATRAAAVSTGDPHSGRFSVRLGSVPATRGDSTISQTFTAPTGASRLSVWYRIACTDTVRHDWATVRLKDNTANTTSMVLPRSCTKDRAWLQAGTNVTAGHSYTLTLVSHDDGDRRATYVDYDDIVIS